MESQHVGTHQGEAEDHQEKSVLQKVKEKARKIKNKLTKHGHGHEQDHHDPDEEDDNEEEDLAVPGATTIGSRATGQGDILKEPMAEFGDTKAAAMHDHDPKVPHSEKTDPMKDCVPAASQRTRQIHSVQPGVTPMHDEVLAPRPKYHASTTESLVGHDQIPSQQPKVDFGKTSVMGEAPHAPQNTPLPALGEYKSQGADESQTLLSGNEGHLGQSKEHTPVSYLDLGEGEHRSNATDPSPTSLSSSEGHLGQSGVHTPVSSLGEDYQKTNVADTRQTSVTGKEGHSGQTGAHLHHRGLDDRTPISSRGDNQKTNVTDPSHTSATGNEGHFRQSEVNLDRPKGLEEDPNAHMADPQAFTPSNDQTKVTDPTNAGGDEVGITPILHSFDEMHIHAGDTKPSNQGSSYTEKVSSAASAIPDKATSAKKAVASTLGYGGGNNDQHEDVNPHADSPENDSTKSGLHHDVGTNHDPKVPHLEKTDPMKDCVPAASQRTRQIHSIQPGVTPMHDEVLEPRPNYHASTTESLVGHDQIPSQQPKVDFGKTSVMGEAPHAPQNTSLPSLGEYNSKGADPSQTFISGKEGHLGQPKEHTPVSYSDLGEHRSNAADPSPTSLSLSEGHLGQSGVHTPVSSLGGDYQKTNVADPRQTSVTGKEGHSGQTRVPLHHRGLDDRTPISSRGDYQKTDVTDPSHTSATGNEGHFGQAGVYLDRPRGLEEDPNAHMADPQAFTPSNDQTKVTDPPNAGGDEVGITPIHRLFDKMNIHAGDTKPSNQGSSDTEKVSSAASAIPDKATSAKNVASTLGYGGGNNDQHEDVNPHAYSPDNDSTKSGQDRSTPENPSNQGSYTGKISSATRAIADTAISAKNVFASKLGYGGDTDQQQHGDHAAVGSGSAAPEQQGKGITAAVTEKLTPEVHQGTATTRGECDKAGKDQGVYVKGYLSEKLKPGEEDKALSEVISETLHERKAEQPQSGARPVGKVTETEEVTKRLGPDYGAEDVQQSGYGKVMADTLKGAVGSLFGKADQTTASPESLGSSTGKESFSSSGSGVAERRGESGK